jgi:type VI secretion system protein VasJ
MTEQADASEAPAAVINTWLAPTGPADETPTVEQITHCLTPFDGGGVGEDPRHGDRFAVVQEEVNRLAGADFATVRDEGVRLLAEEAKDLRIAGFVGLGLVARDGVAGLALGLELMTSLVEAFGESLHPQRNNARQAALSYLVSDRVRGLIEQAPDASDGATRERLDQALRAFDDVARRALGLTEVNLRTLTEWLATTQHQAELQQTSAPNPSASDSDETPSDAHTNNAATVAPATTKPEGERDLETTMRRLLAYLRDNGRWSEHIAMARSWRWAGLALPAAERRRTQVEPPRQPALAPIESAVSKGQWIDGLAAAERAFLEAGGQFLLRIQRLAAQCARQAGYPAAADRIDAEVGLLRARLPELEHLNFIDGTPFASAEDQAWLERLDGGQSSATTAPATADVVDDGMDEARQRLGTDGLRVALNKLKPDAYPGDDRGRIRFRLQQARLCLDADQAGSARAMLEGVWDGFHRGGHDRWDSALACDVLRVLVRATEQDAALQGDERLRRSRQLRDQLAAWDVTVALAT